ncbi:hypothetical protein BJ085DRAFT_36736 [Dimargaris cristalligena]|uniref:Inositol polyphosphate-related phosphatase domain-containing protein n=1 Tax=Dimargaris cristalligena TaxID=215637 RepID=A0A4Q0A187_9FUNG|nr:hypothetical protein BJ085DRAFT_36736 [Dimargaris cristalligena]|eukprot:RKP39794.1 hypothetical protein BJ085DRAFT_36736 [Dimargaris cristalligena]
MVACEPLSATSAHGDLLVYTGTFNAQSRLPYQPLDDWLLAGVLANVTLLKDDSKTAVDPSSDTQANSDPNSNPNPKLSSHVDPVAADRSSPPPHVLDPFSSPPLPPAASVPLRSPPPLPLFSSPPSTPLTSAADSSQPQFQPRPCGQLLLRLPHLYCMAFQEFGPLNTALLDSNNGLIRSCTTMITNSLDQLTDLASRGRLRPGTNNEVELPVELTWSFTSSGLTVAGDSTANTDIPAPSFASFASASSSFSSSSLAGSHASAEVDLTAAEARTGFRYRLLVVHHYAGMLLFIYTLKYDGAVPLPVPMLAPRSVQINRVGCGPAFIGLKGAIGISLQFDRVQPPDTLDDDPPPPYQEQEVPPSTKSSFTFTRTKAKIPPAPIKLCFIGAHLTAHEHLTAQRNRDYNKICRRLVFNLRAPVDSSPDKSGPPAVVIPRLINDYDSSASSFSSSDDLKGDFYSRTRPSSRPSTHSPAHTFQVGQAEDLLFDHDHVFFLGDLNYRTTKNFQKPLAIPLRDKDLQILLQSDELIRVKQSGAAFADFDEAQIRFNPTYKFTVGCNIYTYKKRNPSWCDRILFWSRPASRRNPTRHRRTHGPGMGNRSRSRDMGATEPPRAQSLVKGVGESQAIVPLFYSAHFTYTSSDHRPVSGLFQVHTTPASLAAPSSPSLADPTNVFSQTDDDDDGDEDEDDTEDGRCHDSWPPGLTIDPWWQLKLRLGWYTDRIVGACWCVSLYLSVSSFHLTLIILSVLILIMLIFTVSPYELLSKY